MKTISSKWIGVKNPEDKVGVKDKLRSFTDTGTYPSFFIDLRNKHIECENETKRMFGLMDKI